MKRILLAGYGNISQAFEKILAEQEPSGSYTITTCDLKDGQDILTFLPEHHDEFDVVLNTSQAKTLEVMRMCIDLGLDYIDLGIAEDVDEDIDESMDDDDTEEDLLYAMEPWLKWPTRSHVMCGFGINPGILEHIYQKYKPQDPHYAFQLEHDDSVSDEYEVFGTWAPYVYAEESDLEELVVVSKEDIHYVGEQLKDDGGTMHLTYHGEQRHYVPIPHEELLSMMHSDENLLGTAILYQAPRGLQQYCLNHGEELTEEEILKIPVPHCLKGEDLVGILFWDMKERLYWVKNVMANQTTWKRYGCNAVCWQTATGAWIAYKLLDFVSTDHPHTMTELSQLIPEKIDALLQQIGLIFETEEQPFSVEEFKKNIMRYF